MQKFTVTRDMTECQHQTLTALEPPRVTGPPVFHCATCGNFIRYKNSSTGHPSFCQIVEFEDLE